MSAHEAGGHATRRGHATHLSISDPSHHVTEAIGHMYNDDYDRNDPSRLSYIPSSLNESISTIPHATEGSESPLSPSSPPYQSSSNAHTIPTNGNQRPPLVANRSFDLDSDLGNEGGTRLPSDTATSSFPLNDIDYESNPAAVAQELNNLAAIRRMSMDVAAAGDPDLPGFAPPPSPSADEDDASRLFWVPARLHPELAPKEFKSFLDSKADLIKRRSGDYSTLGSERQGSGGGLNRKRSMLSRQIDNSSGYTDGADRLERQRSQSNRRGGILSPNLQQLETLVDDSNPVVKELVHGMHSIDIAGNEDMPILPPAPLGNSLRRSTRTQYKKAGTLKKGEKLPYPKRVGRGASVSAGSDTGHPVVIPPQDPTISGLTGISTDPSHKSTRAARAPSASSHGSAYPPSSPVSSAFDSIVDQPETEQEGFSTSDGQPDAALDRSDSGDTTNTRKWHSRIGSNGRSTLNAPPDDPKIPAIIETPPATESKRIPSPPSQSKRSPDPVAASTPSSKPTSSHDPAPKRPKNPRQPPHEPASSPNDFANNPQTIPGNSARTDSLSSVPTIPEPEERKSESKKSKDKKDSDGSRKSSWHWLLGGEEKEKKKDKDNDSKKTKFKIVDKTHDNTRLDVLQSSIESTPRGRESLVLDRLDPKLDEERRKDGVRRASGDSKKEKDGLFSSIFGGGRKKHSVEGHHRKHSSRNLSPDPPMRVLRADVDYPWSRFSILEERAIYRMAHIKLANPRRALHSQVLLSNFMYSYLAKVQQMHPQMPVASSVSSQRSSKSRDQPAEYVQYQRYQQSQEQQHYGGSAYEESSMYNYEDDPHDRYGSHSRSDTQGYENGQVYGPGHQQYGHSSFGDDVQLDDDDDDDMW
ncbi:Activator of mitotic machinery Cdc14 phosphatase activation C-terminal [Penicillium italicum]|uniref:Activator of mitotic machinery Cdc14 phosphatase activation C-terminal n=1 Tax=Penicillium italicum TaxID=40296 RepID=A0A0A2KN35_PENIT|nr:Activator of mitotic machinery Cdc14 phosphatase activation C-terminal [Penicillium italicum]